MAEGDFINRYKDIEDKISRSHKRIDNLEYDIKSYEWAKDAFSTDLKQYRSDLKEVSRDLQPASQVHSSGDLDKKGNEAYNNLERRVVSISKKVRVTRKNFDHLYGLQKKKDLQWWQNALFIALAIVAVIFILDSLYRIWHPELDDCPRWKTVWQCMRDKEYDENSENLSVFPEYDSAGSLSISYPFDFPGTNLRGRN